MLESCDCCCRSCVVLCEVEAVGKTRCDNFGDVGRRFGASWSRHLIRQWATDSHSALAIPIELTLDVFSIQGFVWNQVGGLRVYL